MTKSRQVAQALEIIKANTTLRKAFDRALAKANLPSYFNSAVPDGTSDDVMTAPVKFGPTRQRTPEPASAENPEPVGFLALDGTAFDVVDYSYSLNGADPIARSFGWDCYLSVQVRTEAGDSLAAQLADKAQPHGVGLEVGDLSLRGIGVRAALVNRMGAGSVAIVFVGDADSLKVS